MVSRRTMINSALTGTVLVATGVGLNYYWNRRGAFDLTSGVNPLPLPSLERGELKNGVRQFYLKLQWGSSEFLPGLNTRTMGINGPYLGPSLMLNDGEHVQMNVTNLLGEPTTIHWHGLHVPARADGGPHQIIYADETWSPSFTVKQKSSTFWYHPHLLHKTGQHAYYGLAGLIYVEDAESKGLALPQTYGVDDIPLVLQDKRFNRDGSLRYVSNMRDRMMGVRGDVLLVNGAVSPFFAATTDKLRLRIVNSSNARTYYLKFSDHRSFYVVAGDGSLLPEPVVRSSVPLSPGERVEIITDLSNGREVTLISSGMDRDRDQNSMMRGRGGMMGMMGDDGRSFEILHIKPDSSLGASAQVPEILAVMPPLSVDNVSVTRRFVLEMNMGPGMMMGGSQMTINGRPMAMDRIDERVKLDATEIWEILNASPMAHPFHIHDIQFKVLDRDGQPPATFETGLKDTVLVGPRERVRVIAKFEDYADPERPYMYHCHILEHEDQGMMGQFTVEA